MVASRGFEAVLQRHRPDLPVYLLVPPTLVDAFGATGTFVVEATVNGHAIGRRSVKPWSNREGEDRWFLELTAAQMRSIGVASGECVAVTLAPARAVPEDLERAIAAAGLDPAWARLSAAQRRSLAEEVFAARTPETRARRIEKIVRALAT